MQKHRKVEPLSSNLQQKQQNQREFVVPGGNSSIPRSASYEDFRKHRDHQLSSKKSPGSKKSMDASSSSGIRKAKSESDIAMQSLKKKVEVRAIVGNCMHDCYGDNPSLPAPAVPEHRQHQTKKEWEEAPQGDHHAVQTVQGQLVCVALK